MLLLTQVYREACDLVKQGTIDLPSPFLSLLSDHRLRSRLTAQLQLFLHSPSFSSIHPFHPLPSYLWSSRHVGHVSFVPTPPSPLPYDRAGVQPTDFRLPPHPHQLRSTPTLRQTRLSPVLPIVSRSWPSFRYPPLFLSRPLPSSLPFNIFSPLITQHIGSTCFIAVICRSRHTLSLDRSLLQYALDELRSFPVVCKGKRTR